MLEYYKNIDNHAFATGFENLLGGAKYWDIPGFINVNQKSIELDKAIDLYNDKLIEYRYLKCYEG